MPTLTKGANVALAVDNVPSHRVVVGLSWVTPPAGPVPFDVDLSVFLCDASSRLPNQGHVIFASQLRAPTEAPDTPAAAPATGPASLLDLSAPLHPTPQNQAAQNPAAARPDGQAPRDIEEIELDLGRVPGYVESLVFVLTLASGAQRGQTLAQGSPLSITVTDLAAGIELARFQADAQGNTALAMGEVYRRVGPGGTTWKFRALGEGATGGLSELAGIYGATL